MKTPSLVIALLASIIASTQAQTASTSTSAKQSPVPVDTDYAIKERGANHRVWQRTTYEQGPDGNVVPHVHSYTELATGLHYKDASGQWADSQEIIESFPSGAIARQGQHQVIFANNLNSAGAIDVQTPDGKRLRSNILGLMYHDTATDEAVLIARLQDSTGQLISPNQVLYPNAFEGVKADVRYTYRKGSFEQDVILREQPVAPEVYGMNPDTTELEVMTEFINPPEATLTKGVDQADEGIDWGDMRIIRGKAFDLAAPDNKQARAAVNKKYLNVQGRHVLLEKVKLRQVQPSLSKLPLQSSIPIKSPVMLAKNLILPSSPKLAERQPIKLALSTPSNQGYVLDYMVVNAYPNNFTFQGDMTYYVSGWDALSGTTTIEGGTVIKFSSNPNDGPALDLYGTLQCKTASYRPAVFSSKDDNSVGEIISGSTGVPATVTNAHFLMLDGPTTSVNNLRFNYAQYALATAYTGPVDVWDCQFIKCQTAIDHWLFSDIRLHNVLFAQCGSVAAFEVGGGPSLIGENITVDGANLIDTNLSYAVAINLTNSIIRCSPSSLWATSVSTNSSVINPSGPLFKTVGGGGYYLTNSSAYRDVGTTNVNPALLAMLRRKTTYPPIAYPNQIISVATTFNPQAQRDTNAVDLGYHYDPIDYVVSETVLSNNIVLAMTSGTVLGWYLQGHVGGAGLWLSDGSQLNSTGTAVNPCRIVAFSSVQEGNGNWVTGGGWGSGVMFNSTNNPTLIYCQFTHWSTLASSEGSLLWGYQTNGIGNGQGRFYNCEFYSGSIASVRPALYFYNCLFFRNNIALGNQQNTVYFLIQSCTFYNGMLTMTRLGNTNSWAVYMTAFDGTAFSWNDNLNGYWLYTLFAWNAYNTNNLSWQTYPYPYPPTYGTLEDMGYGSLDVKTTNLNWQTSWLGDFYLPTNSPLINAGSGTASAQFYLGASDYHFTTQTNQLKDGDSVVDIGYHYVAVDSSGSPLDNNTDGIPDYLEDSNGNGLADGGETPWMAPPAITMQPQNQTVTRGSNVTFTVSASGVGSLGYQWYQHGFSLSNDGIHIVGATNSALTIQGALDSDSTNYQVVVNNAGGNTTSSVVTLTVVGVYTPVITPGGGFFATTHNATVTCATVGAVIHYTLNGDTPTEADPTVVSGQSIAIYGPATTLNVKAFAPGSPPSGVQTANFNITGSIAAGDNFTVALKYDGSVWAAGTNKNGQVGDGSLVNRSNLVAITSLASDVTAIASGGDHSLALSNGMVWAWGLNNNGQLGDGTLITRSNAVLVTNLTGVASIAAGSVHSLALSNGIVFAWGDNNKGELGDNTTTDRKTNVPVINLSGVTAIAAGNLFSLAISNGTVFSWGFNANGQCGDGTTTSPRKTCREVVGLSGVTAIAAGDSHGLAISNGWVRSWGVNTSGQCGDGTTTSPRKSNVLVVGLSNVVAIAAGDFHSLALLSDGTVRSWGLNGNGQLGDGTLTTRSSPVIVSGLSNVVAIAAGSAHSVALKSDGTIFICGYTNYGLQGGYSSTPVIIQPTNHLTYWVAPLIVSQPQSQSISAGETASFVVGTIGTMPMNYQWYSNSVPITSATNRTLTLNNVPTNAAAGYSVAVNNAAGSTTSVTATLSVSIPTTVIITQPTNQTVMAGSTVSMTVAASGAMPLNYQWYASQTGLIPGATNSFLTFYNVQTNSTDLYYVAVGNNYGSSVSSSSASLTVLDSSTDADGDGLPDWWELRWLGNYSQTGSGDYDNDGINNFQEYQLGTNPLVAGATPDTNGVVNLQIYTPMY